MKIVGLKGLAGSNPVYGVIKIIGWCLYEKNREGMKLADCREEIERLKKEIDRLEIERFNQNLVIDKFREDFQTLDSLTMEAQYHIYRLEEEKETLRTRCSESARDNFDNQLYGILHIVGLDEVKSPTDKLPTEELPSEPIKVAEMLISETVQFKNILGKDCVCQKYDKSDLRQIAEHLLVYCNNAEDD